MEETNVEIVNLPPLRVASFYAYSTSPEKEALSKLKAWALAHSCWQEAPARRIFGFDNPNQEPGSPNRGYEFWITVGEEIQEDEEVKIKEFAGGLYATLVCEVKGYPYEIIPAKWQELVKWMESRHYKFGNYPCLEEHLSRGETSSDDFTLVLFLPIVE